MTQALTIRTDYERDEIIRRMAYEPVDVDLLHAEGQFEGWIDDSGMANWVAYMPSVGRAVWVTNGDPVWYDADSLDDAVRQAEADEFDS